MNIVPIFPTPICVTNLNINSDSIIELLGKYKYEKFDTQVSGSYTLNKKILNIPELSSLKTELQNVCDIFLYDWLNFSRDISFVFTTSWVVKLKPGDSTEKHYHSHSMFSGSLYLDVDGTSPIKFHRPNKLNEMGDPPLIQVPLVPNSNNEFNSPTWEYMPSKNDLILFPSNVVHEVLVNNSDKTRYSLAFNLFPSGKVGFSESELNIEIK